MASRDELNDELPNEWGAPFELREDLSIRHIKGIAELVDRRRAEFATELETLRRDPDIEYRLFDHARKFHKIGSSSIVAIVTAPYERATWNHFRTPEAATERIHDVARRLGLNVRVGHPSDTIYLSARANDPTLPIVWWQPTRVSLPYPSIRDPNPDFKHRIEPK